MVPAYSNPRNFVSFEHKYQETYRWSWIQWLLSRVSFRFVLWLMNFCYQTSYRNKHTLHRHGQNPCFHLLPCSSRWQRFHNIPKNRDLLENLQRKLKLWVTKLVPRNFKDLGSFVKKSGPKSLLGTNYKERVTNKVFSTILCFFLEMKDSVFLLYFILFVFFFFYILDDFPKE